MRRIPPKEYFNPLPPYGGRPTFAAAIAPICRNFNPLPPYGGRHPERRCKRPHRNFNPLPPYGGRLPAVPCCARSYTFQSTPSVWRETSCHRSIQLTGKNFNPLPPYGGRPVICGFHNNAVSISIHSLRMEGDEAKKQDTPEDGTFQSTPSVWRETRNLALQGCSTRNFNPLPPYGGRLKKAGYSVFAPAFQSTPSVWRETDAADATRCNRQFQSTPSVWRETQLHLDFLVERIISIHSLRMEGDWQRC